MLSLRVDRVRDPLDQRGVVCEDRDMAPVHVLGLAKKWSPLAARMRSRAASISALRAMKAASAASLVLGMGWSPVVLSGTIRLAGPARSSGECGATRRHPLTRGVGALLTQC